MRFKRSAFTMIELIFVIVVLGIVASIVSEILAKMYESYLLSRTNNRLQSKTELAVQQIASRLSYRVPAATIAKDTTTGDFVPLVESNSSFDMLEWIGRDYSGLRGSYDGNISRFRPGWTGFIDLESNETNQTQFRTSASQLASLNGILAQQSYSGVSLSPTSVLDRPAIFYKGRLDDYNISLYWTNTLNDYAYPVECQAGGCSDSAPVLAFTENFDDGNPLNHDMTMYEQYYLSHSAYAVVPDGNGGLDLHYGYQPWAGENYLNGTNSLLIDNVRTFRFTQAGEVVRIKLCAWENIGDENVTVCKEKAIL